jgi:hypothetical protein
MELSFVARRKHKNVLVFLGERQVATIERREGLMWALVDADNALITSGTISRMRKCAVELWCDCGHCPKEDNK